MWLWVRLWSLKSLGNKLTCHGVTGYHTLHFVLGVISHYWLKILMRPDFGWGVGLGGGRGVSKYDNFCVDISLFDCTVYINMPELISMPHKFIHATIASCVCDTCRVTVHQHYMQRHESHSLNVWSSPVYFWHFSHFLNWHWY